MPARVAYGDRGGWEWTLKGIDNLSIYISKFMLSQKGSIHPSLVVLEKANKYRRLSLILSTDIIWVSSPHDLWLEGGEAAGVPRPASVWVRTMSGSALQEARSMEVQPELAARN